MSGDAAPLSPDQIREANLRYHDHAARSYDAKWGISFDGLAYDQVLAKVKRALGDPLPTFGRALEIGSGTGYFSLNLMRAGVIKRLTCTDLSEGMLEALQRNATALGLAVETVPCGAEQLPFPDRSFDLVLGHAVLHHLPDLERSLAELARVLKPGGALLFAGEPSRFGNSIAALPKRFGYQLAPLWRRAVGAKPRSQANGSGPAGGAEQLEAVVDVHVFTPRQLVQLATGAGLADARVVGEELLANLFGWTNRALEATAEPQTIPWLWRQYAYRGYLALQALDRALLEPKLPSALFYNLTLVARRSRR